MKLVINSPQVIFERFETEVIVIHLEFGKYFSLRETAADAWVRLESGQDSSAIADAWRLQFPEATTIDADLEALLAKLAEEQLVRPSSSATAGTDHITLTSYTTPAVETYTDMQDLLLLDPVHDVDETGWPMQNKP